MFRRARIKLTAWYLLIIMAISLSFSGVIYYGVNNELERIEHLQQTRQKERQQLGPILSQIGQERQELGLPPLPALPRNFSVPDPAVVSQARTRIITILGVVNLAILGISAVAGYFLAGRTLRPIAEMVEEQKDFVSNASHELRTPLTSLETEIEVALRDKNMDLVRAKALLKSNLEEVTKMGKLSNYLLALNRYQSGAQPPKKPLDLKDVAVRSIENIAKLAKEKGITIEPKLESANFRGDEDSLVQLVIILLDNAVKYSPKKSKVIVSVRKERGGGVVEVKDEGVGIPKKDLPHIFDRFYRADTSRNKEKIDGYGLGLALAKSICDFNGGRISVQSKPGRGSTFTVSL